MRERFVLSSPRLYTDRGRFIPTVAPSSMTPESNLFPSSFRFVYISRSFSEVKIQRLLCVLFTNDMITSQPADGKKKEEGGKEKRIGAGVAVSPNSTKTLLPGPQRFLELF